MEDKGDAQLGSEPANGSDEVHSTTGGRTAHGLGKSSSPASSSSAIYAVLDAP